MGAIEHDDENLEQLVLDVISDPDNLCDDFIAAEVNGDVFAVMVRPERGGMFTIFTRDRMRHLVEQLSSILGRNKGDAENEGEEAPRI